MLRKALFAVLLAALASPALAQETGTRTPIDHKHTLSTAPISDLLGFLNLEFQRKLNETVTFGVSAGTFELDDDDNANVMAFVRYYPQEAALTGFFVGARVGAHRSTYFEFNPSDFESRRRTSVSPAVGLDVGYDWMLGQKRNFYIGLGGGAVRILRGDDDRNTFDLEAFPTARVNVGFAF